MKDKERTDLVTKLRSQGSKADTFYVKTETQKPDLSPMNNCKLYLCHKLTGVYRIFLTDSLILKQQKTMACASSIININISVNCF